MSNSTLDKLPDVISRQSKYNFPRYNTSGSVWFMANTKPNSYALKSKLIEILFQA